MSENDLIPDVIPEEKKPQDPPMELEENYDEDMWNEWKGFSSLRDCRHICSLCSFLCFNSLSSLPGTWIFYQTWLDAYLQSAGEHVRTV